MSRHMAAATLLLGLCATASAMADEACIDNFVADGSFLGGRSYKTWALLPGVSRQAALSQAQAFTVENGFSILNADREAGTISAVQSNTQASGRGAPLNLSFRDEAGGTRITLTYAMSTGQFATEASIRRHFCMTIAAADSTGTPGGVGSTAPAPQPMAASSPPRGHAALTTAQQQAIDRAFAPAAVPPKLRPMIKEAAPALTAFVARVACVAHVSGGSALNEFAAPGLDLAHLYLIGPMRNAQYHDKGTCMGVLRAQGFTAPAANALKFEVVYKADDSGEATKMPHEAVRQPDGRWLFNH